MEAFTGLSGVTPVECWTDSTTSRGKWMSVCVCVCVERDEGGGGVLGGGVCPVSVGLGGS